MFLDRAFQNRVFESEMSADAAIAWVEQAAINGTLNAETALDDIERELGIDLQSEDILDYDYLRVVDKISECLGFEED